MDKSVQKFKKDVGKYLHKSKEEIGMIFGKASPKSDDEIWIYRKPYFVLFKDEFVFIFEKNIVEEIIVTEYFLLFKTRNIYFFEKDN